jgi:hyperosmotically inducible protein
MQMSNQASAKTNICRITMLWALSASLIAVAAHADDNTSAPVDIVTVKKVGRMISDGWITTKVKSELLTNSITKGYDVHVKTLYGAVALNGKLANQSAIDQVKLIAQQVKGVKSVDVSFLTVAGS